MGTARRQRASRTPSRGTIPFPIIVAAASLGVGAVTWHAAPLVQARWTGTTAAPASAAGPRSVAPPPEAVATDTSPVFYSGCREVRAAGAAPLARGTPGYREDMDGDGDGIACEDYGAGAALH